MIVLRFSQNIVIESILKSLSHINTFLDVGCGTGEYLFEMSRFCDEPIGLDISSTYLKKIKKKIQKGCKW
jgi:ubiquinone/menaquinone biosynthesis C-methylase UbiE